MTLSEFTRRRFPAEARFVGWLTEPAWSDPKMRGKGDPSAPKPGSMRWMLSAATHEEAADGLSHFCESIAFVPTEELRLERTESAGLRRVMFRDIQMGEIRQAA